MATSKEGLLVEPRLRKAHSNKPNSALDFLNFISGRGNVLDAVGPGWGDGFDAVGQGESTFKVMGECLFE